MEQAFRRVCVRKAMLDNEEYDHLRQRQHAVVKSTGRGQKENNAPKTPLREKKTCEQALRDYKTPGRA